MRSHVPNPCCPSTVPLKALSICSITPKMGLFQREKKCAAAKGQKKVFTPSSHYNRIVMGKSELMQ